MGGCLGCGGYGGDSDRSARVPCDRPVLPFGNGNLVGGFGGVVSLGRLPEQKEA